MNDIMTLLMTKTVSSYGFDPRWRWPNPSRRRSDLVVMKRLGAGAFGAVNLVEPGALFGAPFGALGMGQNLPCFGI